MATARELDRVGAARISLRLHGWAVDGDVAELSAMVAEGYTWWDRARWDHDQSWLDRTLDVEYGRDPRPWKPWTALPWLVEHCVRRHEPLPAL